MDEVHESVFEEDTVPANAGEASAVGEASSQAVAAGSAALSPEEVQDQTMLWKLLEENTIPDGNRRAQDTSRPECVATLSRLPAKGSFRLRWSC